MAYTSVLKRAIQTCNIVLEELDELYIPVEKDYRLNERMYGALAGLNKKATVEKHGHEPVRESESVCVCMCVCGCLGNEAAAEWKELQHTTDRASAGKQANKEKV